MSNVCEICGKHKVQGGHIIRRGLAKKKGGIGMHVVKNTTRTFTPNIQTIRVVENGRFQDSEKPEYKEKLKLIFVSHGSAENPEIPRTMVELMKSHGLNAVFYEPQGTAHEWLTWRRSLREFVPLIFK